MSTHLSIRTRRLADHIRDHPATTRNEKLADRMIETAILLRTQGDTAFQRADDWANTGLVTGGGEPGSSGDPSNPTLTAALAPMMATSPEAKAAIESDRELAGLNTWLYLHRSHLEDNLRPLHKMLVDILTTTRRPDSSSVAECAEERCTDPAPKPRHGRCDACARWRQRWLEQHPDSTLVDIPPVPADVIADRSIRRRRRVSA